MIASKSLNFVGKACVEIHALENLVINYSIKYWELLPRMCFIDKTFRVDVKSTFGPTWNRREGGNACLDSWFYGACGGGFGGSGRYNSAWCGGSGGGGCGRRRNIRRQLVKVGIS